MLSSRNALIRSVSDSKALGATQAILRPAGLVHYQASGRGNFCSEYISLQAFNLLPSGILSTVYHFGQREIKAVQRKRLPGGRFCLMDDLTHGMHIKTISNTFIPFVQSVENHLC